MKKKVMMNISEEEVYQHKKFFLMLLLLQILEIHDDFAFEFLTNEKLFSGLDIMPTQKSKTLLSLL